MPRSSSSVYDFDTSLTETRLTTYGEYRPFRAREAFLLARRLGRPLTEGEMRQFEYSETNSRNGDVNELVESGVGTYASSGMNTQRSGVVLV